MSIAWTTGVQGVDWEELSRLYLAAPLARKDPADLKLAFGNSAFSTFAWDSGRLIGAGRVLADGVDVAYVCDIALLPDYQGTGLGRELVERLMEFARPHRKILLYAVPGKEPLYRKFGFRNLLTAMALFQDMPAAMRRGHIPPETDGP